MKEKIKEYLRDFLKGQVACIGWMLIYCILQAITIFGLLLVNILLNDKYQTKFYEAFSFMNNVDSMSKSEYYLEVMEATLKIAGDIIFPMLILSSLVIIFVFITKSKVKKEKYIKKLDTIDVLKYITIGLVINLVVSFLVSLIPSELTGGYNTSVSLATTGDLGMMLIATGILGPVAEEITFRHFVLEANKKVGIKYAIIISSLSFGIIHGNLIQAIYAFIIGLLFASEDIKRDNLLPSIIMHISVNTSSVIISSLCKNEITGLFIASMVVIAIYTVAKSVEVNKKRGYTHG